MATRSTVKFYDDLSDTPLVAVYHNWDGEFIIKVEGFQGSPTELLNHTTV